MMEIPRRTILAGLTALPGASLPNMPARADAPPADLLLDWHDPARGRDVPVRLRLPAGGGAAPVVILSHGLGGSRDGLAYLGQALAEAGFVAVHLQHHGSDSAIWRNVTDISLGMAAAVLDVRNAINRLGDVAFALDMLARVPALRGRLDFGRMAIAGHSFGAWTVTHMLGERLPDFGLPPMGLAALGLTGAGLRLPDPRLLAGVALSPVPPLGVAPNVAFERVTAPILYITGTEDRGYIEAATPEDRTIPYRQSTGPAVLAVLAGANHASFAGEAGAGARWNEPTYQRRTAELAVLFLRASLGHDAAARALLLKAAPLTRGDRLESRRFATT